ncbi:TPA: hypothetical protein ACXLHF_004086 [Klebsiella pneumoniae]
MLNKAISHGKEHRKEYRGAKAVDPACRNHGSDDWDRDNRLYRANKLLEKSEQDLEEIDLVTKTSKYEPVVDLDE